MKSVHSASDSVTSGGRDEDLAGDRRGGDGVADSGRAGAQSIALNGLGGEKLRLGAADIAALPHQPVTPQLEGKSEACEGVPLSQILARVGAPQGKALRGPELADVVVVGAADGYRVALALAETDPVMHGDKVFLADRCAGAAMAPPEGPFRLVVLGDSRRRARPARSPRSPCCGRRLCSYSSSPKILQSRRSTPRWMWPRR
jgi:hypothetical protein